MGSDSNQKVCVTSTDPKACVYANKSLSGLIFQCRPTKSLADNLMIYLG